MKKNKLFQKEDAQGHWLHIYRSLGIVIEESGSKHGTCPLCKRTGTKGMRYTDTTGNGQCICTCSPNGIDGWGLLQEYHYGAQNSENFKKCIDMVHEIVRVSGPLRKVMPRCKSRLKSINDLRGMIRGANKHRAGDAIDSYLTGRGITSRPDQEIWQHPGLIHPETKQKHRAMCGLWRMLDGSVASFHRTFFNEYDEKLDGVEENKMMAPKTVESLSGGCIRMMDIGESTVLGLSEGIESGLALVDFMGEGGVPVWACTTAVLLEKWEIPPIINDQVDHFIIAVDADRSFTGQSCSFALARRLRLKGKTVNLVMPDRMGPNSGYDMVDVINNECGVIWL